MTMRTQEGLRVVPLGIHSSRRSSSKGDAAGSTAPMTGGSGDTTLSGVDEARPDAEPGQATERTVFKTRGKRKKN